MAELASFNLAWEWQCCGGKGEMAPHTDPVSSLLGGEFYRFIRGVCKLNEAEDYTAFVLGEVGVQDQF